MKKQVFALFVLLTILLSSCSSATSAPMPYSSRADEQREFSVEKTSGFDIGSGAVPEQPNAMGVNAANQQSIERLIIQNADLTIVVKDPVDGLSQLTSYALQSGGFVVASNVYKTQTESGLQVPEATVTIRVPAEKLQDALDFIHALTEDPAKDVLSENISGQDVTKEYTDLGSRLRNLEDAAEQLRAIMQGSNDTEAVLQVYRELSSVTEQIEVIKGQMQYYEEAAAMSAISVRLRAQETVQPIVVAGWEPQGVARDALRWLIRFWQGFVNFLIVLVLAVLPALLTILLPFYLLFLLIRWLVRRGKKNRKAAPPAAPIA
jgi:hypothetical protein